MSARVLFGFFLGLSSIAVPALAIDSGADVGGATVGGRAIGADRTSVRVGASVDWVSEAAGSVVSGESDSSPSIGGTNLDSMALWPARAQASTLAQLSPAARWQAVPILVAKNEGSGGSGSGKGGTASGSQGKGKSGAESKSGKGGTAAGSQGKSGSQGKGKSGAKSNSGKGGTLLGSQGKGKPGTKGALGGGSVSPNRTFQNMGIQNMGRPQSVSLPLILQPSRGPGGEATTLRTPGGLFRRQQQFALRPGTPVVIVRACREAIVAGAVPHGAVSVSAASAGRLGRAGNALVAPISVSIEYLRQGGIERRQARVNCLLNKEGTVVALR